MKFWKLLTGALLLGGFLFTSAYSGDGESCPYHEKGQKHESMDTNSDGSVSQEEWNEKFKKIDANGDGKISDEELKNHHHGAKK